MDGEIVLGATALVVSIATYLHTRRQERRLRQADLLRAYTNDFYRDPAIAKVFLEIDNETYALSRDGYGTDAEMALVRLLDFLNMVGYHWKQGVLSLDDIRPTTVGYAAMRVHRNDAVQDYITFITQPERPQPSTGFVYFDALATRLGTPAHRLLRRPSRPAAAPPARAAAGRTARAAPPPARASRARS